MSEETKYAWTALDQGQNRTSGVMTAPSRTDVTKALQDDGLYPIKVEEQKRSLSTIELTPSKENKVVKLKQDQIVAMSRMMYLLVRSGLAIPKALQILSEDAPPEVAKMCNDLADRVLSGVALSVAMEDYPKAFDDVYRSYVAAGEQTGNMEDALSRLARMLDKGYQMKLKVKAVTAYPKMVSYAILVMTWGIMTFLVPRFEKIYADLGQELPAPTRALVKLSDLMMPFGFKIGIPPTLIPEGATLLTAPINFLSPIFWVLAALYGFRRWKKANADNLEKMMVLDKLKYRMPIFGKLIKFNVMYRWSATMAGAMGAGLQSYEALDLAGRTAGSYWLELVTIDLREAIRSGRTLAGELGKHPDLFSAQLRAMAATGEEAGEPAEMMQNVANTLEDEIEALIATLGAKIEVALLLAMGVVVGSLLVVLYLPILNLSSATSDGLTGE